MAAKLRENKLDFWIQNDLNVLFKGKHGVGKTSMIIDAFNRNNLKWKYFSASTLDPFADFCGIPAKTQSADGEECLKYILPKHFQDDDVEAIFLDEYNRSHKKIRNAVMELIQFKSINGKKFNNLKIVWAAVNPDDDDTEDYDVEKIDPAQLDRFQVHVDVPYKPSISYFSNKFGKDIADAACAWWGELPKEMKDTISPRRLDYAMEMFIKKGDLRDILPTKSNINKLLVTLRDGPIRKQLDKILKKKDKDAAKEFLKKENNYAAAIDYIIRSKNYKDFFLPLLPEEKISSLIASNTPLLKYFAENCSKVEIYEKVINEIVQANQNKTVVRNLKKHIPKSVKRKASGIAWEKQIKALHNKSRYNTQQRVKIYQELVNEMPDNMTLEEAESTVDLINNILDRTHQHSVGRSYPEIPKLLSICFSVIARDSQYKTVDDIIAYRNWYCIAQKLGPQAAKKIKITKVGPYDGPGVKIKVPTGLTKSQEEDLVQKLASKATSLEELLDSLEAKTKS